MSRRLLRWVGNGLIVAGVVLLVGTFGLLGYSQLEEYQASQEAAALGPIPEPAATATPESKPLPTATPVVDEQYVGAGVAEGTTRVFPTATSSPVAPTSTATPIPILPAQRVVAPSIGLDTKVVESHIVNGEWQVPKFVAGHLEGTSLPLEGGNVVLSGHVQSISSGNVFAKLGALHVGDAIWLYTQSTVITYTVTKIDVVPNNDVEIVRPSGDERLTLITCTGRWLPLQRDYDSRLVVIANRKTS